ncbi:MAG: hypothetical protein E6J62_20635 [Deltaproteobacteria bacterium]|nr:MAG: hypothetical protein E6J85_13750 [Deltaproteobacteria bacterium]TMB26237.1 MAG: hypothetical protein E6J62_20635 [Deltaproteobacteria bacterium]TMB34109.1 MAG: hypothetical protein E6J61_03630 [Deltaproteobacteria bacterium]
MTTASTAIAQTRRGISAAVRSRAGVLLGVAAAVAVFNLVAPVALLSLVRRPADFFTFNPWLRRLPDYIGSDQPLSAKLDFLSHLTIAWASADGTEGIDWGFIIDVPTIARILCTALVFGAYFALWSYGRHQPMTTQAGVSGAARPAGLLGVMTGAFGLTVGPCSLAGCGAPVLPMVGLAFTGLPGGTLSLFATLSRISSALVIALMAVAVIWLGWRVGSAEPHPA